MAGPYWVAVVLASLLSVQTSLGAVDPSWLASIVEGIKNEYALGETFSVAVNIPENQDINLLKQVLQDDPVEKVKEVVSQGQVYQGSRVVAAGQSEGLTRVIENIEPLKQNSQGNVLVIYSVSSTASDSSIADKINDITQNWSDYSFAFSNVDDVPDADTSQLAQSFKLLEISKLGLDHIFRCYKPNDGSFQCISCSSNDNVTPICVTNTVPSTQEEGAAVTTQNNGNDVGTDVATDMGTSSGGGMIGDLITGAVGKRGKANRRAKKRRSCKKCKKHVSRRRGRGRKKNGILRKRHNKRRGHHGRKSGKSRGSFRGRKGRKKRGRVKGRGRSKHGIRKRRRG